MKNHLRGLSFSGRVSMTRFAHGTDDLNRLQNSFLPVLYFEKQGLVCWKKKQNIYERHTPSTLWRCFWNDSYMFVTYFKISCLSHLEKQSTHPVNWYWHLT